MKAIQRTPICLCQSFTLTFWGHRVPVFPSPLRCLLVFVLDSSTSSFYVSFLFSFYTVLAFLSLTLFLSFLFYRWKFSSTAYCYIYYMVGKKKSHGRLGHGLKFQKWEFIELVDPFTGCLRSLQCSIFNWTWLLAGFTLLRFVYFLLINLSVPLTDQFINTNSNRVEGKNRMNFISEIFWFIRIPFLFVGISS